MQSRAPVFVLNQNQQREVGARAQLSNISAARAVSEIVKTTLGPKSMLKMLLDPMGGIVITNDGHCILRELDVSHPAAKSMIDLARTQDENVGDGTTSVIILAGELMKAAEEFLKKGSSGSFAKSYGNSGSAVHPVVIVQTYYKALEICLDVCEKIAKKIDVSNREELKSVVQSCIDTKYVKRFGDLLVDLAVDSVQKITVTSENSLRKEIDIKRYIRIEKIPGGDIEDIKLIDGVVLNKDVTHSKMRRKIENPRILLLDCSLEYKKTESSANVELKTEEDFDMLLKQEEEYVMKICADIIAYKPDLVVTEKGVSDLAQHFLMKANITVLRRLRKTDNNRLARALNVHIVNRTEDITDSNISTSCGLFEVRKLGDEYFSFIEHCKSPKACTIILRGGSKDVLNELERNLQDCLQVARNICLEPKIVPGGGCFEMILATALRNFDFANKETGKDKTGRSYNGKIFVKIAEAFESVPKILLQNSGYTSEIVRQMTKMRALHKKAFEEVLEGKRRWDQIEIAVDGETGEIVNETKIVEAVAVKSQVIKTAFEAAAMIIRIDDIISGVTKGKKK